jgi:hypothetical protein
LNRAPCQDLVERGEGEQGDAADHAHPAEQRVDHEGDGEEERRPRRIEQRPERPADHAAHGGEVAQRLRAAQRAGEVGAVDGGVEQRPGEGALQPGAEPRPDRAARRVERGEQREGEHGNDGQRDQRLDMLGRQHPVIDLVHVERRNEEQEIDAAADHSRGDEHAADDAADVDGEDRPGGRRLALRRGAIATWIGETVRRGMCLSHRFLSPPAGGRDRRRRLMVISADTRGRRKVLSRRRVPRAAPPPR